MKGVQKLRSYLLGLSEGELFYMGTVKKVDKDTDTCVVDFEGLEYEGVQLSATLEGLKGLKVYPKVGSDVVVERFSDDTQAVRLFSELESFKVEIGTTSFELTDLIEIKKGNETLLKIIQDIISEVSKIFPSSGTPPNIPALTLISQRAAQLLK